jgi:ATP phosphoribosyltransferase
VSKGITDPSSLAGGRIGTSFPFLTRKFFDPLDKAKNVTTSIKFVSGSVEAACGLGLADAVVDLVETGTTMRAAGLEVISEVMSTEALLISNPNSKHKGVISTIRQRLEGYITATKYGMISYNVERGSKCEQAVKLTPGKRSPTVVNLADEKYCAVSSLVLIADSARVMDELHDVGATDILIFDIANSRM